MNNIDDKNLVILCATLLAMAAMLCMGAGAKEIILTVTSGLFGVAVGKSQNQ